MKKIIILLFLLSTLTECNTKENTYPNYEDFRKYMTNVHDIDIANNNEQLYYLFNVGCNACIGSSLNLLLSLNKNDLLTIILISEPDAETIKDIAPLQGKFEYIEDFDSKAMRYELGMGKSMFLHIKGNQCVYYKSPKDSELNEIKNYIETLNIVDDNI